MSKINYAWKYIHYLLVSKSHGSKDYQSSFLNDFITNVIRDLKRFDYKKIDHIRKQMAKDKSKININDFGAGSQKGKGNIRSVRYIVNQTSVRPKYGRFLATFVDWLSPSTIIELGTGTGLSTMYMGVTSTQSRIISIEGCSGIASLAKKNINRLGLDNVEIVTGSFQNILPTILHKLKHNLFVFIDGDHYGDHLVNYYELILPFTNENTVFVFDDIRWSRSMERAWFSLIKRDEVSVSIDIFRMGIIFMKKNFKKQHYMLWF